MKEAIAIEVSSNPERTARFRDVLVVGEFLILWIAHAQSRFGDQLARLAIAVLVFSRTSSALLTALTYALSFLPPLVTAPLLSGLADRYPRRSIMVTTDLCRATLIGLMMIPAVPLAGIAVLLVLAVSLQPLYSAARNAMLPNVLQGERYVVGLGLVNLTDGTVQVAGFAFGGVLLALLGGTSRWGSTWHLRVAVGSGVPLVLSALHPLVGSALVLWPLTGFLTTYVVLALAEFTPAVPGPPPRSGRGPDRGRPAGRAGSWHPAGGRAGRPGRAVHQRRALRRRGSAVLNGRRSRLAPGNRAADPVERPASPALLDLRRLPMVIVALSRSLLLHDSCWSLSDAHVYRRLGAARAESGPRRTVTTTDPSST